MRDLRPFIANPGEVWHWVGWDTNDHAGFYVLRFLRRTSQGQKFLVLDLERGRLDDAFMSYDVFNGWKKVA